MERDNFEISQELEQMREQFRILTEKVEKQNIVYEKQLRTSMRKRMNSYDFWEIWMPVIILIICYPLVYVMLIKGADMPVWTAVMFTIFCILGISYLLIKKKMQDKLLDYKGDIRQFAANVKKIKRWHFRSNLVITPISLTVGVLMFAEYIKGLKKTVDISQESLIAAIVAMIIVLAIDVYVDTRKSKILDNIIKEIEE